MKKQTLICFTFILLTISFLSSKTFSQNWTSISSGITGTLTCVTYLDDNTIFASCMDGNIYTSTDGGYSWSVSYTGSPTNPMQSITSFGGNIVISTASDGSIMRYDGSSWQSIPSGTTNSLSGISFTDSGTGFVVGASGIILKSTDGGLTWTNVSFRFGEWFTAVFVFDNMHAMAVTAMGSLVITSDGGTSWTFMQVPGNPWLGGIFMIAQNLAWLCGTNGTMYYYDGSNLISYDLGMAYGFASLAMVSFLSNIWLGYAVGDEGHILRYYSGDWTSAISPTTNMIWWITMRLLGFANNSMASDSTSISACAVGDNGTVLINSEVVVGLNEPLASEPSDLIYPNPTHSGVCFVKGQIPADGIKVTITDLTGNLNYKSSIFYPLIPIDLRHLSNGIYAVQIRKGDQLFVEKLIIAR